MDEPRFFLVEEKFLEEISKNFRRNFQEFSKKFPRIFQEISKNFPRIFQEFSKNFPRIFQEFPRNFKIGNMEESSKLRKIFFVVSGWVFSH